MYPDDSHVFFFFLFFFFSINYLAGSLFLFLQNSANVTACCPGTPRSDIIKSLYLYTSPCFKNLIWDLGDLETSLSGSLFLQIDFQSQIKCCFISKYFLNVQSSLFHTSSWYRGTGSHYISSGPPVENETCAIGRNEPGPSCAPAASLLPFPLPVLL